MSFSNPTAQTSRTLAEPLAAAGFGLAGVLFVVYPALRPYSSEQGLAGAGAFASWQWAASHLCAIVAFVLLAQTVARMDLGRVAAVMIGLGACLVLPYYGAEVFGVGAIGRRVGQSGDTGLLAVVDDIRFAGPAVTLFAAGLLLLAVGGVAAGRALWTSHRALGVMWAMFLALYLPQFYAPPALRVAHGAGLGLAMVLLAADRLRRDRSDGVN